MSDIENQTFNHVACEACRVKKCKCNRVLPTCGQCEKAGTQCIYPQTFKRGFPEGYLAGIEARLAETERALFETLSMLHNTSSAEASSPAVNQVFDFKQTKAARMKEWEGLPLATAQDGRNWFFNKANRAGMSLQGDQTFGVSPIGAAVPNSPWQPPQIHVAGVISGRLDQVSPGSQVTRQSPSGRQISVSDLAGASPREPPMATKAEVLSSTQSRKFF